MAKHIQNIYDLSKEVGLLKIESKGNLFVTIFDKEDYGRISQFHWRISRKSNKLYICTGSASKGQKPVYLSSLILGHPARAGYEVDHINGNSLDNRKANLRLVRRIDNIHNAKVRGDNATTHVRGVSFNQQSQRYIVEFWYNGKRWYLKSFGSLAEAAYLRGLFEDMYLQNFASDDNSRKIFELSQSLTPLQKKQIERYFLVKTA